MVYESVYIPYYMHKLHARCNKKDWRPALTWSNCLMYFGLLLEVTPNAFMKLEISRDNSAPSELGRRKWHKEEMDKNSQRNLL